MTDTPISALPATAYKDALLIPAVDLTKPVGQKNVQMTASELTSALLAGFAGMTAADQQLFAQTLLLALPVDGVAGAQRQVGIPIISGGLVVVPSAT